MVSPAWSIGDDEQKKPPQADAFGCPTASPSASVAAPASIDFVLISNLPFTKAKWRGSIARPVPGAPDRGFTGLERRWPSLTRACVKGGHALGSLALTRCVGDSISGLD
ncbi:MAG: hypothetical protein SangKO_088060 [Sandaracinaceae bacterium]